MQQETTQRLRHTGIPKRRRYARYSIDIPLVPLFFYSRSRSSRKVAVRVFIHINTNGVEGTGTFLVGPLAYDNKPLTIQQLMWGGPLPIFFLFLFICLFGSYDDHLLTNGSSIFFCVFATFGFLSLSLLGLTAPCYHHQPTNQTTRTTTTTTTTIITLYLVCICLCWLCVGTVTQFQDSSSPTVSFCFFSFFTFVLGALLPFFSEHFVAEFFSFFL